MDIRKLDWTLLRSFLAVIDTGSLRAGAKQLDTYQPTLSRQISELESQLGLPLFERTGRGLVPTVAARSIVDAARQMAESVSQVKLALEGINADLRGTVRVTTTQVIASYVMPEVVARLRIQHPEIHIELVASNAETNLLRREADIALRCFRPTQSLLVTKKIGELAMGCFASSAYAKRHPLPNKPAELLKHDLIGLDQDGTLLRAVQAVGLPITRDNFVVRTDDQVAVIRMIERGVGIGFMPALIGHENPDLVQVIPKASIPALPLWLVVHREIKGSKIMRTVFDFLAQEIPQLLVDK